MVFGGAQFFNTNNLPWGGVREPSIFAENTVASNALISTNQEYQLRVY